MKGAIKYGIWAGVGVFATAITIIPMAGTVIKRQEADILAGRRIIEEYQEANRDSFEADKKIADHNSETIATNAKWATAEEGWIKQNNILRSQIRSICFEKGYAIDDPNYCEQFK